MAHHAFRLSHRLSIGILVAALAPYFLDLGGSTIWDANEAYYVETPREMIESGDYVNAAFNYEPRFNKPVLSYWVVAALYHAFGISVAVERAAITAAAMIMIAAAFLLARAASGRTDAALLAAAGFAAGPRLFMFSRRILIDMANSAAMSLVLVFFVLSERYPARRRTFLVLMYASVGVGVLTKGPVAAVLPALAFLVYLAVHREWHRVGSMMIPQGIAIALAIAAPWYVLLYAQHGWVYITEFFVGENLDRYTSLIGTQTRGIWFYLPVVLSDAFPWSLCAIGAVAAWIAGWRRGDADVHTRIRGLLIVWSAVIVVFFTFSRTKQDLYILPIAPAIAALGGLFVADLLGSAGRGARRWFVWTFSTLGAVLAALGAFVLVVFVGAGTVYALDGALLIGAVAFGGGLAVAVLAWRDARAAAVVCTLAVLITANWMLVLRVLPSFERYKPVAPLSAVIAREAAADDVVAHYDVALPSMVFYLRRHIEILFDRDAFLAAMHSGRTVFAVLPEHRYEELRHAMGPDICLLARHPTSDVKLRNILAREAPPEIVLVRTRCSHQ